MSEFGKSLRRIAELGEEMGAIISADWDMIAVSSDWREDGSETIVLHVCADKYAALKAEYQLDWKLEGQVEERKKTLSVAADKVKD